MKKGKENKKAINKKKSINKKTSIAKNKTKTKNSTKKVQAIVNKQLKTFKKQNKSSKKKNNKKVNSKFYIMLSAFLSFLAFLSLTFLFYSLLSSHMLPKKFYKYLVIVVIVFLFIILQNIFLKFKTKHVRIISNIILVLIIIFSIITTIKFENLLEFMDKNLNHKYETDIYYIISSSKSNHTTTNITKLYLIDDQDDKEAFERSTKKKVKVENFIYLETMEELLSKLPGDLILLNSGNYEAILENDELIDSDIKFNEKYKILETIKLKKRKISLVTNKDVTLDPFILYISGIDTRSDALPSKSLSDVNILMIVNPEKKEILLVNTPRDYFVHIAGTDPNGKKDKLTHAGGFGGITASIGTMEELYGIKIDYYARFNFNSVPILVNAINGIDIYNDQSRTITMWTNSACSFDPGENLNVTGDCALAFSRERKSYRTGDRHRGENQQQVITRIFNKVTASKELIKSYKKILNAMDGTFETSLTRDEITSLVNMQLDDMTSWTINKYSVTGYDSMQPTRTSNGYDRYVMMPNYKYVNEAKARINALLEEN